MLAADRVDALRGGDAEESAAAAARGDLKLEPGDGLCVGGRCISGGLCDDRAAVHVLPIRSGVVPADRLAIEKQRRDRLAEGPGELAVRACLALIDLRAFGVKGRDRGLAF